MLLLNLSFVFGFKRFPRNVYRLVFKKQFLYVHKKREVTKVDFSETCKLFYGYCGDVINFKT